MKVLVPALLAGSALLVVRPAAGSPTVGSGGPSWKPAAQVMADTLVRQVARTDRHGPVGSAPGASRTQRHDPAPTAAASAAAPELDGLIDRYCQRCHNERRQSGNLSLADFAVDGAAAEVETAERMIRKLRAGMMPPRGADRPAGDSLQALASTLETLVDRAAAAHPHPGTRPFQRLNRAEYARLVLDVLGITVDAAEWLPADPLSSSFDNIADAQTISPTLMDAYLTAASEVARRAIGQKDAPASSVTFTNAPQVSQHEWERVEGAPFGTRGGISVLHSFPADGEYTVDLAFMSGWGERFHDIDVSVDGERVALVQYGGDIDFQGRKAFPVRTDPVFIRAGEHRVVAAFVRRMDGPYEDLIRPNDWSLTGTEASYGTTSLPHITAMTLEGPYNAVGVSETPSRKRIFTCRPTTPREEQPCAEAIVGRLAARAYGRALEGDDLADLMRFYELGAEEGGFEVGVRTALEAILVSPHFLFRMEREPRSAVPGEVYTLSGPDLAARLSFFLWGTVPDERLQRTAASGQLSDATVLEAEARRLLADPRSASLATRFAGLWLRLQDLDKVQPDAFWFPNYSRQLAQAMRQETELFFDHLVREDRSLLDLYGADYTFLNERLAAHYGVPDVYGEEFRLVKLSGDERRGILGHGSVLVQTSLGNRTSPVLRGKWVMEVLLGTPPPPPPPGVPDLEETASARAGEVLSTRQRMELHRANPSCASCHQVIDPIGLALDNFDVTGKWRIRENGVPLDTQGTFFDGTEIASPADLSRVLLERPISLSRTFTQNLMAYALGRRVETEDQPTVRAIAAAAAAQDYRMSAFILGVIQSDAFRMKQASPGASTTDERTR
ncbi:MAG: DUF1592 domain-containing protein [Gemmatimonadota bacterium]